MKTHTSSHRRAAFTLLELLIVVSIIALLSGMAMGAYQHVMAKARDLQARTVVTGVARAVQDYRVDYGRLPVAGFSGADTAVELTGSNPLLAVLLGENKNELNRRQHAFLDGLTMAKSGVNGLAGQGGSFSLMDPWGQAYRVTMDTNSDNKIANPDAENAEPSLSTDVAPQIPTTVIVESAGKDKQFGTRDDIVSWR